MDYDYTIISEPDDFFLSDTIRRELEKRGKKCLFSSNIGKGWRDAFPYTYKSPIFIAVVNNEFINHPQTKTCVELNQADKDTKMTYVLTSEANLTLPKSWKKVEVIDVCRGLNMSILDTILAGVTAPQPESVTAENPEQDDEDAWILQRHSRPAIAELMLNNGHEGLSMTVQHALRYLTGDGVPQDASRTVSLLSKAIDENPDDVVALYYLGASCEAGVNIDKKASDFYRKAAGLGHTPSALRLAFSLIEEDTDEAAKLLKQAREEGVCEASYGLGLIAERAEKYDDAVEFYSEAAELGHAPAQNALACFYIEGKGVNDNDDAAYQWLQLAANQGLTDAMANLGAIMVSIPDNPDMEKGVEMLRQASAAGNAEAAKFVAIRDEAIAKAKREQARAERRRARAEAEAEAESSEGSGFLSGLINASANVGSYAIDRLFRGN